MFKNKLALANRYFLNRFGYQLLPFKDHETPIMIDYAPNGRPRYGATQPPLPNMTKMLEAGRPRFIETIESFTAVSDGLARIPEQAPGDERTPHYQNIWVAGIDAVALYAMPALRRPSLFCTSEAVNMKPKDQSKSVIWFCSYR